MGSDCGEQLTYPNKQIIVFFDFLHYAKHKGTEEASKAFFATLQV